MRKEFITFSLATAIISLPVMATSTNISSTTTTTEESMEDANDTSLRQERMESVSTKDSAPVRNPSETGTTVRKNKTTTQNVDHDEHDHDDY